MSDSWHKLLSREGVDVTTISGLVPVFYEHIEEFTGQKDELFFSQVNHKTFTHYIKVNAKELGRFLYKKYFSTPEQIETYYREGILLLNTTQQKAESWKKLLQEQLTSENLLRAFTDFSQDFQTICHIYSITSWVALEAWQEDFEKTVSRLITLHQLEEKREVILASLYQPWKATALREVQEKIRQGVSPQTILEEYQFLRSWAIIWYRPLTPDWLKEMEVSPQTEPAKNLNSEQICQLLHPNPEEEMILKSASQLIFFKDWRDDVRRKQAFIWSFLFDALATFWHIERETIGYASLDEITLYLRSGKPDWEEIRKRVNGCVVTKANFEHTIQVLPLLPKYVDLIQESAQSITQSIRGLTAEKGQARGIARIIHTHHDLKRVENGDIMISNTTHPDYLPAMHKAAAFVTNEGGVISHAAIVARELKKPCIVGTKNATQLIKEGDLVEVDATLGTVTVLN